VIAFATYSIKTQKESIPRDQLLNQTIILIEWCDDKANYGMEADYVLRVIAHAEHTLAWDLWGVDTWS